MPYSKSAEKTMANFQQEYGSNWQHVYYALANKRAGKGLKGTGRGRLAANKAFAKGSSWRSASKKRSTRVRVSRRRLKG